MPLNNREVATVLAALRHWQRVTNPRLELEEIASDGGTLEPLSVEEIDDLCERINCSERAPT